MKKLYLLIATLPLLYCRHNSMTCKIGTFKNCSNIKSFEFLANEEKDWFFHCHILYHMATGMARGVGAGISIRY